MMIGPEPMTITLWMSVRFGMSALLPVGAPTLGHEVCEAVEEVGRVMRTCGRLGVVLHGEAGQPALRVAQLEALDDVVVEAHVAHRHLAELRGRAALQRCVHG